jgi:hypothetical protein
MQTGVSSAAVPGASLAELLTGVTRHGLSVIELRAGDAHGVSAALTSRSGAVAEVVNVMRASPVTISSYRDNGDEDVRQLAVLARELGALIVIDGPAPLTERLSRAQELARDGAGVAVVVRGARAADDALEITRAGHGVAWDASPSDENLGAQAAAVLDACGDALRRVRVAGAGPESSLHEGRGIGALMSRLALAGYAGTVIVAPSSPIYHQLWKQWLGPRDGAGRSSHSSNSSLVNLELPASIGGTI